MPFSNVVSPGASELDQGCHLDVISNAWASRLVAGSTERPHRPDQNIIDKKSPVSGSIFSARKSSNLSRTKPPPTVMPQIEMLNNIPLHSPTPIVGTPFDVKANFEYPFPPDREVTPVSSSAPTLSNAFSSCSQHFYSTSPSHITSISPPPLSTSYNYKLQAKMRQVHTREPPVPPELIRRRRRSKGLRTRSPSSDSYRAESETSEDINWGSVLSYTTDSVVDLDTGQRERKREREAKRDGSVDLGRSTRMRQAEGERRAADKALTSSVPASSDLRYQK